MQVQEHCGTVTRTAFAINHLLSAVTVVICLHYDARLSHLLILALRAIVGPKTQLGSSISKVVFSCSYVVFCTNHKLLSSHTKQINQAKL